MNTFTPSRVRPGVSEGGQFATSARSESEVSLDPNELANMVGDGADWSTQSHSSEGHASLDQWREAHQAAAEDYRQAEERLEKAAIGTAVAAIRSRYPAAQEVEMYPGDRGLFNEPNRLLDSRGQEQATGTDLMSVGEDGDDVTELLRDLQRSHHHYPFMHTRPGETFPALNLSEALTWARTTEEQS